jgi:hypothetical protein
MAALFAQAFSHQQLSAVISVPGLMHSEPMENSRTISNKS